MRPFVFERAATRDAALQSAAASQVRAQYLAGGTTLIDLMKLDVMRPEAVIDINALGSTELGRIDVSPTALRLGALARMADAADHRQILTDYPVIAQSL